jgi:hypothetical protein
MASRQETTKSVRHVDIVKNEWLAGFQTVVARLALDEGKLQLDAQDPAKWEPIVWRVVVDRETGEEIGPDRAEDFFARLHERLNGDYLFATTPHDERECPYHGQLVVPITPTEQAPQYASA